jgi:hypothetical protein
MSYLNIDRSQVNRNRERPQGMSLLGKGDHEVIIESCQVTQTSKGHDQLEINYKNESGSRKQWILFGHTNEMTKRIAIEQLDDLLLALDYKKSDVPDVSWYEGKPVKITIYAGKKDTELKVQQTRRSAMLDQVSSSDFSGSDLEDEIPFGN